MSNPKNNPNWKPINERAKEMGLTPADLGRIGGRKARGQAKALRIKPNRKCTRRCPLWDYCPFKYISITSPDRKCALANAPPRAKSIIRKVATGKESEFNKVVLEAFTQIYLDVITKGTRQEKMKFLRIMSDLKKSLFGDRKIVETKQTYEDLLLDIYDEENDQKDNRKPPEKDSE